MPFQSLHGQEFGYDRSTGRMYFKGRPVDIAGALLGEGRLFYVSSVDGQAASSGKNARDATATLAQALAKCVADRGDIILLGPGHTETIGDEQIEIDIAGVTILGLGHGSKMARFHHNHANAEIAVVPAADNVTIQNVRFSADVTGVLIGIDVEAAATNFTLRDCLFDTVLGGTDEYAIGVQINAGCTGAVIENNVFDMGIAACVTSVKLTGASDRPTIKGNQFYGDASGSHILGITTLSTRVLIDDNLIVQGVGGDIGAVAGITLLTGTTGIIRDNDIVANLTTKAGSIVADTCLYFRNMYNEDIAGTGGEIGVASADD